MTISGMTEWDLAGAVRRIRRAADMSQRELALAAGVSPSVIARAETETRDLPVRLLARLAALADLRLALLDPAGAEVAPMDGDAVRDAAGRLLPAHLDTRHGDDHWWGGEHRPRTRQPRYTFDVDRGVRDSRRRDGAPTDHHVPRPGDSLAERAEARQEETHRRVAEERERRFREHPPGPVPDPFTCWCPDECDDVADLGRELPHAQTCTCRCDLA
jgi:transcriptional regulator with XRE-family HTH domain